MMYATHDVVTKITEQLEAVFHNTTAAEHAAWWLLQKLTGISYTQLVLTKNVTLSEQQEKQLDQWLYEMVHDHKPLAYILGDVPFLDVTILVEPPILIPRPETEEWCNILIQRLKKSSVERILDICTGTGCIALALAKAFPKAQVTAGDIEPQACALTQRNAQYNGITNVTCVLTDVYEKVPQGEYNLIVANPPYITDTEWPSVELSVKNWEDEKALRADDQGLAIIQRIITGAPDFLKKGGQLWIEIGYHQGEAVMTLFKSAGFHAVEIIKDHNGNDRVVCGVL